MPASSQVPETCGAPPASAPSSVRQVPGSVIVTRSIDWAGMALPVAACVVIWGIGNASAAGGAWLPILHKVIAGSASVWTALRFILRQRRPHMPPAPDVPRAPAHLSERVSLVLLYTLLVLQPLLALAGSMLHGNHTTVFGFAVPSILPVDQLLAVHIDHLHGGNAVLLLALIAIHIVAAVRKIRQPGSHV
jgi:cytochrome b561